MRKIFIALFLLFALMSQAQTTDMPFNGVITDVYGMPAKRARVYVKNANTYALTDKYGRFGLTNVAPDDTIKVKYGGRIYVIPVDGMKSIRLRLADQQNFSVAEDLALVNAGFYYVKKRERTTSSSFISGEDLVRSGRTDLLEALRGKVPGLQIFNTPEYGGQTTSNIRGLTSINGPVEPLYIVDGVIVESLTDINVFSVDHVEVIKDANIYGAQGGNGAIVVYTKHGKNY